MGTDEAPAQIAVSVLNEARAARTGGLGAIVSAGAPVSEVAGPGIVLVRVPVTAEHGGFTLAASVAGGWLTGLEITPGTEMAPRPEAGPWRAPGYADPDSFTEQDVTVGTGPRAVPGTLTRPRTPGPHPAVVLLTGSGANDRDETIGQNKPFKDLAWGLATRGLAVLRYDKVSYAHGEDVARDPGFTEADEYVPDAVAAVALLRADPAGDRGRASVLGHSQGGAVPPRVAAAEPPLAGLVIMAGGPEPMAWAAVRQLRYLASLSPE